LRVKECQIFGFFVCLERSTLVIDVSWSEYALEEKRVQRASSASASWARFFVSGWN